MHQAIDWRLSACVSSDVSRCCASPRGPSLLSFPQLFRRTPTTSPAPPHDAVWALLKHQSSPDPAKPQEDGCFGHCRERLGDSNANVNAAVNKPRQQKLHFVRVNKILQITRTRLCQAIAIVGWRKVCDGLRNYKHGIDV